jgi:2-succinyl-6-hydroxy-2,4-cyclohexadiene-1-carboxylate synthase
VPEFRPLTGSLHAVVAGRGPRVVFVHGFTQTGRSWTPVAEQVARLGHEVVLVDLPGHGGSTSIRADLRRSADLLAATTGPATYVGYSLGGRVCLHLALMYPHVVERLVLVGASPGIVDDEERSARRDADDQLAVHLSEVGLERFLDEWTRQPLFSGLELTEDERQDRLRNTAAGLASSLRLCGTGTQVSLWERLVELNMDVLALAGDRDTKFASMAERIAQTAPNATFDLIHDAGHAAHLQQPAQVITRLERFMRGDRVLPPA